MLEKLDDRVAASIDPNFSANRTYFLDNTPSGLRIVGCDAETKEDFVIPLVPEQSFREERQPIWDEFALVKRKEFDKKRRILEAVATVSSLLVIAGIVAFLLKGVD